MKKYLLTLLAAVLIAATYASSLPPKIVIVTHRPTALEIAVSNRSLAKTLAWDGWGWNNQEWKCLSKIIYAESKYNHKADNKRSTAYGMLQMLGETSKDPQTQLLHGYKYIAHRYETPCKAWRFHTRHHYY